MRKPRFYRCSSVFICGQIMFCVDQEASSYGFGVRIDNNAPVARMIGRVNDRRQLTGIQPIQLAARTIVDDHVASARIVVRIHPPAALWAEALAVHTARIGRWSDFGGFATLRAQRGNQHNESRHGNQIAPAARTAENPLPCDDGMHQGHMADGTRKFAGLVEYAHTFHVLFRHVDCCAVLARGGRLSVLDTNGSAAIGAVHVVRTITRRS